MEQALNECELPTVFCSSSHNHQSIDQFAGLHLPDDSQLKRWLTEHNTPIFIAERIKRQYLLIRDAQNVKHVAKAMLAFCAVSVASGSDLIYIKNDAGEIGALAEVSKVLNASILNIQNVLSVQRGQGDGRKIFEAINHYAVCHGFKTQQLMSVLIASLFYEKVGFTIQDPFHQKMRRSDSDVSTSSDFDALDQLSSGSSDRIGRLVEMSKETLDCSRSADSQYGLLSKSSGSREKSMIMDALQEVCDQSIRAIEVHRWCLKDLLSVSQDRNHFFHQPAAGQSEWKLVNQRNSPVSVISRSIHGSSSQSSTF